MTKKARRVLSPSPPSLAIELNREVDGRWIAEIPELPGVLVYGATKREALRNLELARKLSLSERKVLARALLASPRRNDEEDAVTAAEVLAWSREIHLMRGAGKLIPYDQVRRELGLGPYAKGKQPRRRH